MISLIHQYSQWGRSEVIIIFPDIVYPSIIIFSCLLQHYLYNQHSHPPLLDCIVLYIPWFELWSLLSNFWFRPPLPPLRSAFIDFDRSIKLSEPANAPRQWATDPRPNKRRPEMVNLSNKKGREFSLPEEMSFMNKNPPTPLWRWRRACWGAISYTKCSMTFVNIAVAISAIAGARGAKNDFAPRPQKINRVQILVVFS